MLRSIHSRRCARGADKSVQSEGYFCESENFYEAILYSGIDTHARARAHVVLFFNYLPCEKHFVPSIASLLRWRRFNKFHRFHLINVIADDI